MVSLLGRGKGKRRVKGDRHADESAVFQTKPKQFIIDANFRNERWRLHSDKSLTGVPLMFKPKEHRRHGYEFFTNTFPGNCRSSRFISSPSKATETAEAGKPLRRMMSSMPNSSLSSKS